MKNISERLKYVRRCNGLSQSKFAAKANLKQGVYYRYESGERQIPTNVLESFIEAYAIRPEWLIKGVYPIYDYKSIQSDLQWKRLYRLRREGSIYMGDANRAAKSLGVDEDTYFKWEHGEQQIPSEAVDQIYETHKDWLFKEWWYSGEGVAHSMEALQQIKNTRKPPSLNGIQDVINRIYEFSQDISFQGLVLVLVKRLNESGIPVKPPK